MLTIRTGSRCTAVAKVVFQVVCPVECQVDLEDFRELAGSLARVDPAVQPTMMMDRPWRRWIKGTISNFNIHTYVPVYDYFGLLGFDR